MSFGPSFALVSLSKIIAYSYKDYNQIAGNKKRYRDISVYNFYKNSKIKLIQLQVKIKLHLPTPFFKILQIVSGFSTHTHNIVQLEYTYSEIPKSENL